MTLVVSLPCLLFKAKKTNKIILLSSLLVLLCSACDQSVHRVNKFSGATMGTTYHVSIIGDLSEAQRAEFKQEIQAQLDAVNDAMSTYQKISELVTLNKAELNKWHYLSPDLASVIAISQRASDITLGGLDITVGPLVNLWGFGPQKGNDQVPSEKDILRLKADIGMEGFELDAINNRIRKIKPVKLDLSAIAKGYGADKVAEMIMSKGIADFLVEVGGELRLNGHNAWGKLWRVGIESPSFFASQTQQTISLSGKGVATSGDYRNYFEVEGVRYSHTIDPRSGYPITHSLASITVVAETTAMADALATGLNVLGKEKAMEIAIEHDIAVFIISKTENGFEEDCSPAFKTYMR